MPDPSLAIGILHLGATAYVVAVLGKLKIERFFNRFGLGLGLGEMWALAFVLLIGLEALFRLSTELYSVWFFARNTLGGLGLTWLVFERIANAHRQ